MTESDSPDPRHLRPGPILTKKLSQELLELIKAVYDVVGPYLEMPLEKFELSFMRDTRPEREVAIWCSITAAWIAYHEQYLSGDALSHHEEKKILGALIAISGGTEEAAELPVTLEVGQRLLECYDASVEE